MNKEEEELWHMYDELAHFVDKIEYMRKVIKNILVPSDDINEICHSIKKSSRGMDGAPFID